MKRHYYNAFAVLPHIACTILAGHATQCDYKQVADYNIYKSTFTIKQPLDMMYGQCNMKRYSLINKMHYLIKVS